MEQTKTNIYQLVIFCIAVNVGLLYYSQLFIVSDEMFYTFYSAQLSYEQIGNLLEQQQKWSWLGYVFVPLFYIIKIWLITGLVYAGFFALNIKGVRFRDIMPAVVKADMLFLIPAIAKAAWFTFYIDYTLEDIQYFMPGSALQLFDYHYVEKWLVYPLQAFNVWEVGFWFLLAWFLRNHFKGQFDKSFQTVMLSYGSGFVIWILFIVFLSINMA